MGGEMAADPQRLYPCGIFRPTPGRVLFFRPTPYLIDWLTLMRAAVGRGRYNENADDGVLNAGPVMRTTMSPDKTILRIHDPRQQEQDTLHYWQNLPLGERLSAVWDVSEAAWSFAAAFKGGSPDHDARRPERTLTRVERPQR